MPRFFTSPSVFKDCMLLSLLIALLFGFALGARVYSAPSESRYIEIGREMAESGDYVTPRLDYVKYFEKPPFFYWVQALWTKAAGVGPFVSRVPTAAFSLLLCLVTYALGRQLYGQKAGWLGAMVLATTLYLFALSRVVLVDVPVSLWIVCTLTEFLYVIDAPLGRARTLVIYGMYAAAALAVLSKGLIGAVLPGAVCFLWMLGARRFALLKTLRLPSGVLLFLAIAAPWHILVAMRNPEFLHFYFIHEHVERYFTKVHGRYHPAWFFLAVGLAGLFPWLAFGWQAMASGLKNFWQERANDGRKLFLFFWIVFIFLFFSLSDSKLIPYILPIFPPIAALIGGYLAQSWEEKRVPGFTLGLFLTMALYGALALAPALLPMVLDPQGKVAEALAQAGDDGRTLAIFCITAAGALLVVHIQGRRKHVILTLFLAAGLLVQLGNQVAGHYDKDSMQLFAALIKSQPKTDAEVAMYGVYYQDMPIYLERRVTLVDWEGELEFGSKHQDVSAWIEDDAHFWPRWKDRSHPMFLVMRDDAFALLQKTETPESRHLYPVRQDGRNLLFTNQPPEARR